MISKAHAVGCSRSGAIWCHIVVAEPPLVSRSVVSILPFHKATTVATIFGIDGAIDLDIVSGVIRDVLAFR